MAGGSLVKEKPKVLALKNSRNCFYCPVFVKIIHTLVHTFRGIFTVKLPGATTALDFFSRQGILLVIYRVASRRFANGKF